MALAVRVSYVEATPHSPVTGQARALLSLGGQIAAHGDYSRFDRGYGDTIGPTAFVPPALPYLIGAGDLISGQAPQSTGAVHLARLEQAVLGAAAIALIALIALELAGPAAALAALVGAALYPPLIHLSATIAPENLLAVLVLGAAWATLRARSTRDSVPWLIAGGILTGLASLTHVAALLLLIPLALGARGTRPVLGRRQVAAPMVLIVSVLFTLSPWLIRDAAQLNRFVPITDGIGPALAGVYNPASAADSEHARPFRTVPALHDVAIKAPTLTEPQLDAKLTGRALTFIADHPQAPFEVAAANAGRLLDRSSLSFWILTLLAAVGALTRAGRRAPPWLWCVPLSLALAAVLVNGDGPATHDPIDPFLIVLAACAVATPLSGLTARVRGRFLNWQYARRA